MTSVLIVVVSLVLALGMSFAATPVLLTLLKRFDRILRPKLLLEPVCSKSGSVAVLHVQASSGTALRVRFAPQLLVAAALTVATVSISVQPAASVECSVV